MVLGANGLGAALAIAGWWGASGTSSASAQLGWLNLALLGLLVAGTANGLWLGRARRTISLARAMLLPYPPTAVQLNGAARSHAQSTVRSTDDDSRLVSGQQMTHYHRASCLLVAGKAVKTATRAQHAAADRTGCGVCQP